MKQRVLLIEDDPSIRAGLEMNLRVDGYDTESAVDGEEATRKVLGQSWDMILLDLMLPKIDGLDVLKQLRGQGITTPVIVLSARGHEVDKVAALEMGADDYVSKPFGLAELLSRIRAVLRRMGQSEKAQAYVFGNIEVDFHRRIVRKQGQDVELTAREFDLLAFLVENAERVLSREQLINQVWDMHYVGTPRTVDNFIAQLRAKLEDAPESPLHFLTVRGIGYRFSPGLNVS